MDFFDWLGGSKKGEGISVVCIDGVVILKILVGIDLVVKISILGFLVVESWFFFNFDVVIKGMGVVLKINIIYCMLFDVIIINGEFSIDVRFNFSFWLGVRFNILIFIFFLGGL